MVTSTCWPAGFVPPTSAVNDSDAGDTDRLGSRVTVSDTATVCEPAAELNVTAPVNVPAASEAVFTDTAAEAEAVPEAGETCSQG